MVKKPLDPYAYTPTNVELVRIIDAEVINKIQVEIIDIKAEIRRLTESIKGKKDS